MKPKFLISISFLLFITCQYISELKHKDEIVSEAYVNNPNGLALYKIKGDLKSKEVVLNPEEKFYFLEKSNEDVKESWRKVLYGGKELFAYSASYSRYGVYEYVKLDQEISRFGFPEKEIALKETPFKNAKELEKIPAFSVVEILAFDRAYNIDSVVKVKVSNDKIGFIDQEIKRYKTQLVAEKNAKSEISCQEGYFLVTTKEPVILDIESMLPIEKSKYEKIMSQEKLFFINSSKKIDGIKYYFYKWDMFTSSLLGDPSMLIPEMNGKFLNEKEYTEYTIQNSNYKGDISIFEEIKNKGMRWLNFKEFTLIKLPSNSKKNIDYLAVVGIGDTEHKSSYVIRQTGNKNSIAEIESSYSIEVKTLDIDKDGILEIISKGQSRGGAYFELFGMRNGKYELIAEFLPDTEIKNDLIYAGHMFEEHFPRKSNAKPKIHSEGTKLKYQKGKLIKIK